MPRARRLRARRSLLGAAIIGAAGSALLASCGNTFDPPNKVQTVRIIAVTKDALPRPADGEPGQPYAYAHPGGTVTLNAVVWDGKSPANAQRPLQISWLAGCNNPAGDLYYGCYSQFADMAKGADAGVSQGAGLGGAATRIDPRGTGTSTPCNGDGGADEAGETSDAGADDAGATSDAATSDGATADAAVTDGGMTNEGAPGGITFAHGTTFTFTIPPHDEIITHKNVPGSPDYGLSFVFFAACAGNLLPLPPGSPPSSVGIPFGCFADGDSTLQHPLGVDDFVVGYSAIYVFDSVTVDPMTGVSTIHENANPIVKGIAFGGNCDQVPVCTASNRDDCPKMHVQADIDRAVETDPTTGQEESMWVDFYASGGDLKSSVRLVNDPSSHFNDDNGTEWTAPATAGRVRIWAVVHDNRGGLTERHIDVDVGVDDADAH